MIREMVMLFMFLPMLGPYFHGIISSNSLKEMILIMYDFIEIPLFM